MSRWAHVENPAIDADWLVENLALDPHDEPKCPNCGGRLKLWPGEPARSEPEDGGVILYWQQTHSCGARLRVLADLRGEEL
jgi:hypothetical protein